MWDRLSLEQGILFRTWYDDDKNRHKQLVVPKNKQIEVLHYLHDIPTAAHLGAEKTLEKVRQTFYWSGMKDDIQSYCLHCSQCTARKTVKPARSPLGSSAASEPLERCAIDIFGPLPKTKDGNSYVLVICDCFTRWTEAIPLPNQEAGTIAKAFVDHYVSRFGVPMVIHSDQGRNFTSKLFSDMCDLLQIHHTKSTPLHPQSNGLVERFNRTLATMLTMYCAENQSSWDKYLPQVMLAYRSSINSSTGQTPNKMVFGRDVILPIQACIGLPPTDTLPTGFTDSPEDYVTELRQQLALIHSKAREVLKTKTEYRKRHYDLYARRRSFMMGDHVWVHDPTRRPGICSKLSPRWKGPCLITSKIDDLVYLVKRSAKVKAMPIHIDRLMKYAGSQLPAWLKKKQKQHLLIQNE
jgi:hypothetical protein